MRPPNEQNQNRANHGSNETSPFALAIPSHGLSQIGRDNRDNNTEDSSKDEPLDSLRPGVTNFAMIPATKPMTIVRIMRMVSSPLEALVISAIGVIADQLAWDNCYPASLYHASLSSR